MADDKPSHRRAGIRAVGMLPKSKHPWSVMATADGVIVCVNPEHAPMVIDKDDKGDTQLNTLGSGVFYNRD